MPHAPRFAHRTVRHGQSDLSAMPPPLPGLVIAYRSVLHRTSDVSTSPGRVRMRCLAGNTGTDEFTSVASLLTGAVTDRVTLTLQASGTTHLRYYHLPAPAPAVSRVDISQDDKTWNDGRPQRQCDPGSARAPAASFRSADGPPHSTWSSYWDPPAGTEIGHWHLSCTGMRAAAHTALPVSRTARESAVPAAPFPHQFCNPLLAAGARRADAPLR